MKDELLIETLLYRGEGNSIDFKLQQFEFEGVDDIKKSELLKDLLAFANAWREGPAYILIGVRDETRELVGLDKSIDDSRLQQFVNGKLNRPLHFIYRTAQFEGKTLGLYEIPVQERPIYSQRNFGKVKADAVYVRRGSSTAEAKPDEIAKMGAVAPTKHAPMLQVRLLASNDEGATATEELVGHVVRLALPADGQIPDYPEPVYEPFGFGIKLYNLEFGKNKNYYRQFGEFLQERYDLVGFHLEVKNAGDALAEGVKITITVSASESLSLTDDSGLRSPPKRSYLASSLTDFTMSSRSGFLFDSSSSFLSATLHIGKIHAGDISYSDTLYLVHPDKALDHLTIRMHADQLTAPLDVHIPVSIGVEHRDISVQEIRDISVEIDGAENDDESV